MWVLMCTMLTSVLMVMTLGVRAMFVSMLMRVLMFMIVGLSLCMCVIVAMDRLVSMRSLHGGTPFKRVVWEIILGELTKVPKQDNH